MRFMSASDTRTLCDAVRLLANDSGEGEIDNALLELAEVPPETLQRALTLLVRTFVANNGQRPGVLPVSPDLTATEAIVFCHGMLRATDLEVFELGIWNPFGG